jgi:hypothetical protein
MDQILGANTGSKYWEQILGANTGSKYWERRRPRLLVWQGILLELNGLVSYGSRRGRLRSQYLLPVFAPSCSQQMDEVFSNAKQDE